MENNTLNIIDHIPLAESSRSFTDEGYLILTASVATFDSVQLYKGFELGSDVTDAIGKNPTDTIRIYRPTEEVLNKDSLKSYRGKSVTIEHPEGSVGKDNHNELEAGVMLSAGRESDKKAGMVDVDIILKNQDAIDKVNKTELSLGYSANYNTSQTPNADLYLTNVRINHVSLVDKGRANMTHFHDDKNILNQKEKLMTKTKIRLHLSDEEFIDSEFEDKDQASHVKAAMKWSASNSKLLDKEIKELKEAKEQLLEDKKNLDEAIKELKDSLPKQLQTLAALSEKARSMTDNKISFEDSFSSESIMTKTLEHLEVKIEDGADVETLFNFIFANPQNEKVEKVIQKDSLEPIPSDDNVYTPSHGGFFR